MFMLFCYRVIRRYSTSTSYIVALQKVNANITVDIVYYKYSSWSQASSLK